MKAQTLWQPWASLVAEGLKRVETRCWATKYRGPLAHFSERFLRHKPSGLIEPKGYVLCTCTLVSIELVENVRDDLDDRELAFGNFEDGRYAWFLENIQRLVRPIPTKGNRLLWEWDAGELYLTRGGHGR